VNSLLYSGIFVLTAGAAMSDMGVPFDRSLKKRSVSSTKYLASCLHAEMHQPQVMHHS
jgi:hypothetical protein